MKNIAKSLLLTLTTTNIAYAIPAISNELSYSAKKKTTLEKVAENFTFSYFAQYTGKSLSNSYEDGATYNRFSGGRSDDGQRYDTTGSTQLFQSLSLGYKLPKSMVLSYGITFQDNLTNDVKYKTVYGDTQTRSNGRSQNDHRVSLWVPGIAQFSWASLSSSFFYQIPTTDGSIDTDMRNGAGIQPVLNIYSQVAGLSHGLTASYERYFYPDYEFYQTYTPTNPDGSPWKNTDGSPMVLRYNNPTKRQGMLGSIGGYLNYMLTDRVTFKSSVAFDYDQRGDEVGSLTTFGNNLDNVGNVGLSYMLRNGMFVQGGVNFAIEEAAMDKTALFGSFSLTI